MARILTLSSWVASGHVGLSAIAPVLHILGHEVVQLPTVVLSNHPGFAQVGGAQVAVADLEKMRAALAGNGFLTGLDAVLTGYLPSAAHVEFAAALLTEARALHPGLRVVVDPVLGDAPKGLYLPRAVADAVRARLVPLAGVVTPNAFELGWLTGARTGTLPEALAAARKLAASGPDVLLTSAPVAPGQIGVAEIGATGAQVWSAPQRNGVPQGVGDVFAGLIAAGLPVGAALGHLAALIDASLGAPHLRIAETHALWSAAPPLPAL